MKVACKSNALSELLLTPYHRSYFETNFGPAAPPVWSAEIGREYTVYAVSIHRGYPFYFVAPATPRQRYQRIPSLCFEIIDPRPSRYWRIEMRVVSSGSDQIFATTMAFKEWFEPMFLSDLVDGREPELRAMEKIAKLMDCEFD